VRGEEYETRADRNRGIPNKKLQQGIGQFGKFSYMRCKTKQRLHVRLLSKDVVTACPQMRGRSSWKWLLQ
jgi:hypothetical protein